MPSARRLPNGSVLPTAMRTSHTNNYGLQRCEFGRWEARGTPNPQQWCALHSIGGGSGGAAAAHREAGGSSWRPGPFLGLSKKLV